MVPLGDYVDRGPNSPRVIDRLLELRSLCHVEPLLGNHEIMMQAAIQDPSQLDFWLYSGGQATLEAYGGDLSNIPECHLEFFQSCQRYVELEDHFFVHANFTPHLPLDKQPDFALFWEHLSAHLPQPHVSGKTGIVGHTPQRDGRILRLDHLICIDTYCYGGGWLTAFQLENDRVWQADNSGHIRDSAASPDRPGK